MSQSSPWGLKSLRLFTAAGLVAFTMAWSAPAANAQTNGNGSADTTTGGAAAPSDSPTDSGGGSAEDSVGNSALEGATSMITAGGAQSLGWALRFMELNSKATVNGKHDWFGKQYEVMRALAVWVMVPLVLVAIIHSIAKGSMQMLMRVMLVYLPISVVGTVMATEIVQLLLNMVDDFSLAFLQTVDVKPGEFFQSVIDGLNGQGPSALANWFLRGIFGFFLMFVSIAVYVVLVLREASVYLATSFLPIGFAMLVWPSTARFFTKMVEFLLAMIFSKLVMVAGLSLAIATATGTIATGAGASIVGGSTSLPAGTVGASDSVWPWATQSIQACAILALVAFAPTMVIRIMDLASIGSHLNRPDGVKQVILADRMVSGIGLNARNTAQLGDHLQKRQEWAENHEVSTHALRQMGILAHENPDGTQTFAIDKQALDDAGVDARHHAEIERLSRSQNPNEVAAAHYAYGMGADFDGFDRGQGPDSGTTIVKHTAGDDIALLDVVTTDGRPIERFDEALVARTIESAERMRPNSNSVRIVSPLDPSVGGQHKNLLRSEQMAQGYTRHAGGKKFHVVTGSGKTVEHVVRDRAPDPVGVRWPRDPKGQG